MHKVVIILTAFAAVVSCTKKEKPITEFKQCLGEVKYNHLASIVSKMDSAITTDFKSESPELSYSLFMQSCLKSEDTLTKYKTKYSFIRAKYLNGVLKDNLFQSEKGNLYLSENSHLMQCSMTSPNFGGSCSSFIYKQRLDDDTSINSLNHLIAVNLLIKKDDKILQYLTKTILILHMVG